MKAKKLLALLLTGAMAAALGTFAIACNKGNNPDAGGTGGGGGEGGGGGTTADYTLDETEYYLAGNGAGDLKQNNWSETNPCLPLVRDESADHNVFTITIDMYARDEFKIVHDNSYTGEIGFSAVTPYEVLEGGYSNGDANAKGPVSKNADGEVVFYEGGGFGGNITLELGHDGTYKFSLHTYPDGEADTKITWEKLEDLKPQSDMYLVGSFNDFGFDEKVLATNHMTASGEIWRGTIEITAADCKYDATGAAGTEYAMLGVRNEVPDDNNIKQVYIDKSDAYTTGINENDEYNLVPAGVYTVTYNSADNSVTIKAGAHDIYFIGSMNGWSETMGDEWKLTENLTTGMWTGYIEITEDDYVEGGNHAELKLFNKLGSRYYPDGMGNNIELTAGDWGFSYNPETDEVKYEKSTYFVVGSFTNAQGEADDDNYNFKLNADSSIKLNATSTENVYTADYNFPDVSAKYSWVAPGVFALKVVYGTTVAGVMPNTTWYGGGEKGEDNVLIPSAGEYTVTFNAETGAVTVAETVHEVTVTFNLNYTDATGAPAAQTITSGTKATKPTPDPDRTGFTFDGWYTAAEEGTKFDFDTAITADTVLYAHWIDNSQIQADATVTFNYNYGAEDADYASKPADVEKTADSESHFVTLPAEPTREGYYFLGWYTAAEEGTKFDADTVVTATQTVYAHWRAIDQFGNDYHLVGKVSGHDGKGKEWNPENKEMMLTHSNDHPTDNIFTISIRLFAGNVFKILGVYEWAQPEIAFDKVSGGNGSLVADGTNIKVAVSGDYVLTLNTNEGQGHEVLTYTVEPLPYTNDMYFVLGTTETKMTAGTEAWTGYITVDGEKPLKLIDKYDGNKEYPVGDGNLAAGEYFVKFNVEAKTVEYEKCEFYLVGSFTDENGKADDSYNFKLSAKAAKKLTKGDGNIYTIDLEVKDVSAEYTWVKPGVFAIKIVYGTILGDIKDWHGVGADFTNQYADKSSDGNILPKTVGTYTITIDASSFEITITKTA